MAKTKKQGVAVSLPSSPLLEKEQGKQFTVDLYIRVSTFSQLEGDSLEEQESELRKFCDYRGFQINRIYCEEAKSGGTTKRPEYQKLISDIENHRIDAVVVKKLDRLSRSLLDFEQLMVLMQRNNIEFMSLRENFDTTTAMGKAMLRMALVFAQLEREQTSERVSDVMQFRASQGLRNGGTTPFGYVSVNKELIVSQKEKSIVELIFKSFLSVHSVTVVANQLNEAKISSPSQSEWTETNIDYILKNPVYKGHISWKSNTYIGQHEPLIAPSVWDAVDVIFQAKKRSRYVAKNSALLQKLAHCGTCNTPLVPSFAYNRSKVKYEYYRCGSTLHGKHRRDQYKCTFKYVSFVQLHAQVQMALLGLSDPNAMTQLDDTVATHNHVRHQILHKLSSEIAQIEIQLQQLKAKKNEYVDVLITKQFTTKDHQRIHDRMNELDRDEKQHQSQLATLQLEQTNTQIQILNTDALKRQLLIFRDTKDDDLETYRSQLLALLEDITVFKDALHFRFKDIPFPVIVPIDSG